MSDIITPVLLCGGSGTRLWPLSRKSYPKQFGPVMGDESLFQTTLRRLSGERFSAPIAITAEDFRFIVSEQLSEVGEGTVLIEPSPRDTAPAVLAAALWLERSDPGALMLVAPSDHVIADAEAFRAAVEAGIPAAREGRIVTFGIRPDRAETGYGYLELAAPPEFGTPAPVPLERFVEKPDAARAEDMVASGRHLWNAGIFLASVATLRAEFERLKPLMLDPVAAAVAGAESDLGFSRLASEPWQRVEAISLDYAIMERAEGLVAVPYAGRWTDLGGWEAVWREAETDANGVATRGGALALDCHNTLLRAERETQQVVGIGLKDTIVVAMPDAVLVADRSKAQEVKQAVAEMKARAVPQAETFPRDYRPWGWFETLVLADRFQVKRIMVKPGAALSLQSHVHRAEHWIVVSGTARVTVNDEVKLVSENQSVYIPLGATHRMENPGKVPMTLIEVQTGAYLGEDDIIRYEDVYKRS